MEAVLKRVSDMRFVRYFIASVGALAVDMGTFLALLSLGMIAAAASAIGYCAGILAHWLMSSRAVFRDTVAERGRARTKQKALFVVSALAGLVATIAIVGAGDLAGLDPRVAKLIAIVVSFLLTYTLRASVVFRGEA